MQTWLKRAIPSNIIGMRLLSNRKKSNSFEVESLPLKIILEEAQSAVFSMFEGETFRPGAKSPSFLLNANIIRGIGSVSFVFSLRSIDLSKKQEPHRGTKLNQNFQRTSSHDLEIFPTDHGDQRYDRSHLAEYT